MNRTHNYLPANSQDETIEQKPQGCLVVAYSIVGVSIILLGLSIWAASLVNYSELSERSGGANIGKGLLIISVAMFCISSITIGITVFFLSCYQRRPGK